MSSKKLKTIQSTMSNIQPYPRLSPFTSHIKGIFCYIIKHYGNSGYALRITRSGESVSITASDWTGKILDLNNSESVHVNRLLSTYGNKLVELTRIIRLPDSTMYFVPLGDGSFRMVDLSYSKDLFAGPGMIRDLFSAVMPTQEVVDIKIIDDITYEAINAGSGTYDSSSVGDLILKPSKFRTIHDGNYDLPYYVEVKR